MKQILKSNPTDTILPSCSAQETTNRTQELFNSNWKFARYGEMPDGSYLPEPGTTTEKNDLNTTGSKSNTESSEVSTSSTPPKSPSKVSFDDSSWRILDLPHDWGIEGPFRQDLPGWTGKLPWVGIGWYRKTFTIPSSDQGKRIFLQLDGAMSDSSIYLNGTKVGAWPYGYTSFQIELTDTIKFDQHNQLAIRLDNKPESSRWYPGSGIYRNVWLLKTDPVHIAHWGTFITTPKVSVEEATAKLKVTIDNQSETDTKIQVSSTVYKLLADGKTKAERITSFSTTTATVSAKKHTTVESMTAIAKPDLWDTINPHLYCVVTTIRKNDTICDTYETVFGIRTINYEASKGFLLNEKVVKLQGVCQHDDLGPLGTAVNTRALERQLEILKEMGCNSIRTCHNPPSPELLQLSDRMGMLLQVEAFDCWEEAKKTNDYSRFFPKWHKKDLINLIHRDRNHPSVIMWSTGNEVREQITEEGHKISRHLTKIIKDEDPTRPVTAGASYANASFNGFQNTIDVHGLNYKPHLYQKFKETNPLIPFYGSETSSCISSRGEYFFPVSEEQAKGQGGHFQVSSYDMYAPGWAYPPDNEFKAQDEVPETAGEYVWTGFDYLGEPIPYNQDKTTLLNFTDPAEQAKLEAELKQLGTLKIPSRSSYFGILDLCGFKKDRFYFYQARWLPNLPMVHILPHWNWPERVGKVTPVHIYTSGDEVELFLNEESLGKKRKAKYEYRLRWDNVIYQPGTLKAVSYKNGKKWAEKTVKTTDKASSVKLKIDRSTISADGYDLSFITVIIADSNGCLVPRSRNLVKFNIEGPGKIIAVGNGDATSHASFQAKERHAFNGLCLVVVRSLAKQTGNITLTAISEGLNKATTVISSE